MRVRAISAAIVLGMALSIATGCSQLDSRLKEELTPPAKIVTQEATVAVSGAQVDGELSEETPESLPLWPGARVKESRTTEDAYSLTLIATDTYSDVLKGVVTGFEEAGWEVAAQESGAEGAQEAVLDVATDGQEGLVTITQTKEGDIRIDYVIAPAE